MRGWLPVLGGLGLLVPVACARQAAPSGGEQDRLPPVVVSTRPDTFETLEVVEDRIRIAFNERISESPTVGTLDEAIIVSPSFGEVSVDHARDALEVDMSGAFRPGYVYRVTVRPVIRDMFGNTLREPFEFVFSTGGEFHPGVVAGLVLDRVTGEQVEDARVEISSVRGTTAPSAPADSAVYVSRTDTSGIFAVRFLPGAAYDILAYVDRDRDMQPDPFEIQGRSTVTLPPGDTLLADVVVLEPDTTPAVLGRAQVMDSVSLLLTFDDHLDPEVAVTGLEVSLAPDSTAAADAPSPPDVAEVFHAREYFQFVDSVARQDSILRAEAADGEAVTADSAAADLAGDSLRTEGADSARLDGERAGAGAADTARAARRPRDASRGRQEPVRPELAPEENSLLDVPLPTRYLVVLLEDPLPPDVPYRVTVEGVRNLVGLPAGGGSVVVVREPPAADTAAAPAVDSLAPDTLRPDSLAPDTLRPDTLRPDTLRPDSLAPDTLRQDTLRQDTLSQAPLRQDMSARDALPRGTLPPDPLPRLPVHTVRLRDAWRP